MTLVDFFDLLWVFAYLGVIALGVLLVAIGLVIFTSVVGFMLLWVLAAPVRLWRAWA